jgi:acyl carrier protein
VTFDAILKLTQESIAKVLPEGTVVHEIMPEHQLKRDLNLDSLAVASLVFSFEGSLGLDLTVLATFEFDRVVTVGDLIGQMERLSQDSVGRRAFS